MKGSALKGLAIWLGAYIIGYCLALPGLFYLLIRFAIR